MIVSVTELSIGEAGQIARVDARGALERRLRELGVVTGARLSVIMRAPLGDPLALGVLDSVIAVRARDARGILVDREARV